VGVHSDSVPLSNPSAKTGTGGGGVVTDRATVRDETLPAISRARTEYRWVDDPRTPVSVYEVTGPSDW
jgi:hypothetical protein